MSLLFMHNTSRLECLPRACGEVLHMIKFTKNLILNPAEIRISGIRCSFNNIVKISTVFDFKWIAVTIDSVAEGSSLLEFVKDQGLKYFAVSRSSGNAEISVVVPYPLFEDFLDNAIKENPENIFIFNFLEPVDSGICLQRSFEELVATRIVDVFISIALDENTLLICMNKSLVKPQEVFRRLNGLCFD